MQMENDLDLSRYLRILRKWWWLLLACTLVAGVSSYLGSRQMPRIYQATTTVMVGQSLEKLNPTGEDLFISQQLAQTYAEMVKRGPILAKSAEALGLPFTPAPSSVTTRTVPGTQLLEISARDTDPERARMLADEIARQLSLQTPGSAQEAERRTFAAKQLEDLETKIQDTEAELAEEQRALQEANSARAIQQHEANIRALEQKLSSYQATHATLFSGYQGGTNRISVVQPAATPMQPVSPNVKMMVLLAAAIGFGLAAAGTLIMESIEDTVQSPEEASQLTGLPLMASIPHLEGEGYADKLVTVREPWSPAAEAYRALTAKVKRVLPDGASPHTLLMTSAGPSEGKSLTLANMGVVLAERGNRVLIVDADLRRPVQHEIFGLSNVRGLADVMPYMDAGLLDIIQKTEVNGLYLLPAGVPSMSPGEMLTPATLDGIVAQLRDHMDIILFDSPPVLPVADALVLSEEVQSILIVTNFARTSRKMIRQAVEELRRTQLNPLGIILNEVAPRHTFYHYRSHYGYLYTRYTGETDAKGSISNPVPQMRVHAAEADGRPAKSTRFTLKPRVMRWALGAFVLVAALVAASLLVISNLTSAESTSADVSARRDAQVAQAEGLSAGEPSEQATTEASAALTAEAAEDCAWLQGQRQSVATETLHEDLIRLERLWSMAEAGTLDATMGACSLDADTKQVIEEAVLARWDRLQAFMAQDSTAGYQAVVASLSGLEGASISGIGDVEISFRQMLVNAHLGLAQQALAANACDQVDEQLDRAEQLAQQGAWSAEIATLRARVEKCLQTRETCARLRELALQDAAEQPGDALRALSALAEGEEELPTTCGAPAPSTLAASRLAAMEQMLDAQRYTQVITEALKVEDTGWFTQPPDSNQQSPAELAINAYLAQAQDACLAGTCGDQATQAVSAAEALYAKHRAALAADAQRRIDDLLGATRSVCASCGAPSPAAARTALPLTSLSLLDAGQGKWSPPGIYYGDTGNVRNWYLSDEFVRSSDSLATPFDLDGLDVYTARYEPTTESVERTLGIRMEASVIGAKRLGGIYPLWGMRVPRSDDAPAYLLLFWTPSSTIANGGTWSLRYWQQDGEVQEVPLSEEPWDATVALRVLVNPEDSSYDVYWQGEMVLDDEPLIQTGEQTQLELLIGEGAFVWIHEAHVEVLTS